MNIGTGSQKYSSGLRTTEAEQRSYESLSSERAQPGEADLPRAQIPRTGTDIFTPAKRSQIMKAVRTSATHPEIVVHDLLTGLGYRYQKNVAKLPGKPDVVIGRERKAIFINGCFWHGHEDCKKGCTRPKANRSFWQSKISANIARDRRTTAELRKIGWSVLTVWECQLNDPKRALVLVSRFMRRKRNAGLEAGRADKK